MKEMRGISKFTNLENNTFKKGFLCMSDGSFLIAGCIYYTKLFTTSNNFEDLLAGKLDISFKFNLIKI